MMPMNKFIGYIFQAAKDGQCCIETCIVYSQPRIAEHLFGLEAVKKKYEGDNALLFRLVWYLNSKIDEKEMVKFVVNALDLTEARLKAVKSYRTSILQNCLRYIICNILLFCVPFSE